MKLTTVRLYGKLGKLFGRTHQYAISSPMEAMRAMGITLPGFIEYMREHANSGFRVILGGEDIGPDMLGTLAGGQTIKIVPVVAGAEKDGMLGIVIGIVIVIAACYTGGASLSASSGLLAGATSAGFATAVAAMGWSMILGGIAGMLATGPDPLAYNKSDGNQSYLFGGANSATQAGGPVPVLYGELEIPGVLISGGISPEMPGMNAADIFKDTTGAWYGDGLSDPLASYIGE